MSSYHGKDIHWNIKFKLDKLNENNLRTEVYLDFLDEEDHNDIYIVFVFFLRFYDDNNDLHRAPVNKNL